MNVNIRKFYVRDTCFVNLHGSTETYNIFQVISKHKDFDVIINVFNYFYLNILL